MSIFKTASGVALFSTALGLMAGAACAQSYTIKVGGGHIDPHATTKDLVGTMPASSGLPDGVPTGNRLEVQSKSVFLFNISRSFGDNFEVELALGAPPKHDVKLRVSTDSKIGTHYPYNGVPTSSLTHHFQDTSGQVVATLKQTAPTVFINYKFRDPSASLRPYVGLGLNYTRFKAEATQVGTDFYNDGPVKIKVTDSIGLAAQAGVTYHFDKHWSASVGLTMAEIRNKVKISTNTSHQEAEGHFFPTLLSANVGYTF